MSGGSWTGKIHGLFVIGLLAAFPLICKAGFFPHPVHAASGNLVVLGDKAYKEGLYQLARQQWQQYIREAKGGQERYYAEMMVGETYILEGKFKEAAGWYGGRMKDFLPEDTGLRERFLYRYGEVLFKLERYQDVKSVMSVLLQEYPGGKYADQAAFMVGESAFRTGMYRESLPVYQMLSPGEEEIARMSLYRLAQAHYFLTEYEKAGRFFQRYFDRYPEDSLALMARYHLAESLFMEEKYLSAAYAYSEFGQRHPGHSLAPRALYREGEAYYREGRYREAAQALGRLLKDFPGNELILEGEFLKSLALIEMGRLEEASLALGGILDRTAAGDALRDRALYWLGVMAFEGERYRDVVLYLSKLNMESPDNVHLEDNLVKLGLSSLYLGEDEEAEKYFHEILEMGGFGRVTSMALFGLGEIAYRKGEFEAALEHYRKVDRRHLNTDSLPAYLWHAGESSFKLGETLQAERYFKSLTAVPLEDRQQRKAFYTLGMILMERERPKEALLRFDRALKVPGDDDERKILMGKARALIALDRITQAMAVLGEIILGTSDDLGVEAAQQLAALAEKQGEWPLVKKALSGWPGWPEASDRAKAAYLSARASCRLMEWEECLNLVEGNAALFSGEAGREGGLEDKSLLLRAFALEGLGQSKKAEELYESLRDSSSSPQLKELAGERLQNLNTGQSDQ
jgi:TolA-binding protein